MYHSLSFNYFSIFLVINWLVLKVAKVYTYIYMYIKRVKEYFEPNI